MKKSEISELLQFLRNIEEGNIQISPNKDPALVYAGNVTYHASNGWELTVFNDSNEWDYIDQISTNDGRVYDFDNFEIHLELREYIPPKNIIRDIYQFPEQ